MGGILILIMFEACGLVLMDALLAQKERLIRIWFGLCAGLVLMMWLPALFAFGMGFTKTAQLLGLALAAILSGGACLIRRRAPRNRRFTDMPLWLPLALIVPMALLGGYLQYTHTLRDVAGDLHVGQSTYGDLCLHLGIATSLRGRAFPPDYALLPGTLLGYPFLGDSMVTTMLLFGGGLASSFVITGTLMLVLVFTGFVLFAWSLTHSRAATVLAFVLMFVNGGLGFLYTLDGATLRVNQFMESEGEFEGIKITQKTNYPFDGRVEISYRGDKKTLALRLPSWCDKFELELDGAPVSYELKNGYIRFEVRDGDSIVYSMEIKPAFNFSNPKVAANASRTSISMGPLVYCAEAVDNKGFSSAELGLDSLCIDTNAELEAVYDDTLKLPAIYAKATYRQPMTELYTRVLPKTNETKVKFIPYHAFANRGESDMQVWMLCK